MTAHFPAGSFGGVSAPSTRPIAFDDALARFSTGQEAGPFLAHGNGRSYGDSCLLGDGALVLMRSHDKILSFDRQTGMLHAQAGALFADIIAAAAPHGWFLPVTPGTKFVTLGGAIANDVHGKNHHVRGTFGRHVASLSLLRSDGTVRELSAETGGAMFAATIGGMGLTGIVTDARIRLMPVAGLDIDEEVVPFAGLDAFFALCEEADARNEYVVAWIDQAASGRAEGRGVLFAGNHRTDGVFAVRPSKQRLTVPFVPPVNLVNRPAVSLFNRIYGWAQRRRQGIRHVGYDRYFYPLDGIGNWNRLYGRKGFFQHQSIVPADAAREAIATLLRRSREAGHCSFLTVLKKFGAVASPGILSFPRAGYTLTMDFANRGGATAALLAELDAITIAAGGAVNPYKDARMSAATFRSSFPRWEELEANRDPGFMSDFWKRTVTNGK